MMRPSVASILAIALVASTIPAAAEEKAAPNLVAPSPAVAAAWAREDASRPSAKATRALFVSYTALQTADMASTILARRAGAAEVNPVMNVGLPTALTTKSLLSLSTVMAARAVAKKNKKAAIGIMIALNSMTAIVVANNVRNAARLK